MRRCRHHDTDKNQRSINDKLGLYIDNKARIESQASVLNSDELNEISAIRVRHPTNMHYLR
jgi:hypothetical protein